MPCPLFLKLSDLCEKKAVIAADGKTAIIQPLFLIMKNRENYLNGGVHIILSSNSQLIEYHKFFNISNVVQYRHKDDFKCIKIDTLNYNFELIKEAK